MKIIEHRLRAYRLPYRRAVTWSDTREDSADYLLLTLTADDGRSGMAEVTLKRTWSGSSVRTVIAAVEDLFLPLLCQDAPTDATALLAYLDAVPENSAAKALVGTAMDLLLADRSTATEAVPLSVPVSWALTRQSPALMAAEAVEMVERHGFRTLKVKGGQGMAVDAQALHAIRQAVPGVACTVDANGAYPCADAAQYVSRMADAGAVVVEDPAPLLPDASLHALLRDAPVPVLIDFPCASAWHAHALLAAGCRALNVKPGRYGLPEARRIARLARDAGAATCIGLFGESALGSLINLQIVRDEGPQVHFLPAELTFYLTLAEQLSDDAPAVRDGCMSLPPSTDLHRQLDEERLVRYAL